MPTPPQIEKALGEVKDQRSFIERLLRDTLEWPVDPDGQSVEDIGYRWSEQDLRTEGLTKHLVKGQIWQIPPFRDDQPWGIFVLEFEHPEVFRADRGMAGTLRKVLRGLVASRRRPGNLPAWKRENLLFVCNHEYRDFRFASFRGDPANPATSRIAAFGWGPDIPRRTACEFNLPPLAYDPGVSPDEWVAKWTDAFDVEKVTKRFYSDYARVFAELEASLEGPESAEDRRLTAQTLMNRLMFLRFVERKGWLKFGDGNAYLRNLAQAGGIGRKSIYRSRLKPLFFEALGSPTGDANSRNTVAVGDVPFLGGGLFEESDQDKLLKDVPDASLRRIIGPDGLFYHYNFTVEESTPLDVEVAVDPEMLGKVFEELVTGRHGSGSYYTPRPVVSFMCREALKGFLADKAGLTAKVAAAYVDTGDVAEIDQPKAREVITALDGLKAVDPACGSGAYLLGLLHELIRLYALLYSDKLKRDARSLYDLKLQVISHSLYGVDIDPFATSIAMLRLWLSLVVEAADPVPLPNLDFKIETGDSLVGPDPHSSTELFGDALTARADLLIDLKDKYLSAQAEARSQYRAIIDREISSIAFRLRSLRGEGVIDWRIQFAEVFVKNQGFDVVLANPPYIRKEEIPVAVKPLLQENFAEAITGRSDLYCAFYARATQLLRPGGLHVFVCSSSWLDAEYGVRLQQYLLQHCTLVSIHDSAVEKQFSTANINTVITVFRRHDRRLSTPARFVVLHASFSEAICDPAMQRVLQVSQAQLQPQASGLNGKWGGRFLRAPRIYSEVFVELSDRFVPLRRLATVDGYIHDNNTGRAFPKRKVLWSVRDAETVLVTTSTGSLRHIGVSPVGNSNDFAPVLFPRTFGTRHIVPWVEPNVLGKEFYKIRCNPDILPELVVLQLNSTLGILQREILGIKGLGGGALKFAGADVEQFMLLPDLPMSRVAKALTEFVVRPIRDLPDELEQRDRRNLDSIMFERLGLTSGQQAAVYEATAQLVEARRAKARSNS